MWNVAHTPSAKSQRLAKFTRDEFRLFRGFKVTMETFAKRTREIGTIVRAPERVRLSEDLNAFKRWQSCRKLRVWILAFRIVEEKMYYSGLLCVISGEFALFSLHLARETRTKARARTHATYIAERESLSLIRK